MTTAIAPLIAASFRIDDGPVYPGYTRGELWNGWACPRFTKAVADRIIVDVMTMAREVGDQDTRLWYDEAKDTYFLVDNNCLPDDEPEGYEGFDADNGAHLYTIGAWYWCWDVA